MGQYKPMKNELEYKIKANDKIYVISLILDKEYMKKNEYWGDLNIRTLHNKFINFFNSGKTIDDFADLTPSSPDKKIETILKKLPKKYDAVKDELELFLINVYEYYKGNISSPYNLQKAKLRNETPVEDDGPVNIIDDCPVTIINTSRPYDELEYREYTPSRDYDGRRPRKKSKSVECNNNLYGKGGKRKQGKHASNKKVERPRKVKNSINKKKRK